MSGNCVCCYSSFFWIAVVALLVSIQIIHYILGAIFGALHLSRVYKWIAKGFQALSAILVLLLAVWANSPPLQNYAFSKLAVTILLKDQPLDQVRCDHFKHLSGRVLEIGPGPGTNFRCWGNNSAITEWVGVEPNIFFQELLSQEKIKKNITFPTKTVWLKGENVDVEPESFDYVVAAHVLCSVDDVGQVVTQIKRALKPGGTYYFLEHVAASPDTTEYIWQQALQPLITIVGAGCKFKELWQDIDERTFLKGYDVQLRKENFPMSLAFFSPHIIGKAIKPTRQMF